VPKTSCRLLSTLDQSPRTLPVKLERLFGVAVFIGAIGLVGSIGILNGPLSSFETRIYRGAIIQTEIDHPVRASHRGVVTRVAVNDGDRVNQGDPLVEMNMSLAEHDLKVVEKMLLAAKVKRARLEAEIAGETGFAAPANSTAADGDLRLIVQVERMMLESRRRAHLQELDHARQRQMDAQALASDLRTSLGDAERLVGQHENEVGALTEMVRANNVPISQIVTARAQAQAAREARSQIRERLQQAETDVTQAITAVKAIETEQKARLVEELDRTQQQIAELTADVGRTLAGAPSPTVISPGRGIVRFARPIQVGDTLTPGTVFASVMKTADARMTIQLAQAPEKLTAGRDVLIEDAGRGGGRFEAQVIEANASRITVRVTGGLPELTGPGEDRPRVVQVFVNERRSQIELTRWIAGKLDGFLASRH
jgi:multidrug resistance efflux pump